MSHVVTIEEAPWRDPEAARPPLAVRLNGSEAGELVWSGAGYSGSLPSPDGPVDLGEAPYSAWSREAERVNEAATTAEVADAVALGLERRLGSGVAAAQSISAIVRRTREVQTRFLNSEGLDWAGARALGTEGRAALQSRYDAWLPAHEAGERAELAAWDASRAPSPAPGR